MKKLLILAVPLALSEGWNAQPEQEQQAKAGAIVPNLAESSNDDYAGDIASAQAPVMKLGALVAESLEATRATANKEITISGITTQVRTLQIGADGSAESVDEPVIVLTRDVLDGETEPRKSAPWTVAEGSEYDAGTPAHVALKAAIVALCAATKPKRTLSSMIDAIEDYLVSVPLDKGLFVDQAANGGEGTLSVVQGEATNTAPEVTLVQTIPDEDTALPPSAFE